MGITQLHRLAQVARLKVEHATRLRLLELAVEPLDGVGDEPAHVVGVTERRLHLP